MIASKNRQEKAPQSSIYLRKDRIASFVLGGKGDYFFKTVCVRACVHACVCVYEGVGVGCLY